ncbi:flagellar export protein FliJ [Alteromonas ponticola]|uniref:Flagellar FliJ protein n=1 Tax=Alteromonas aquimaris TaxID=2998417 RepID=A0ABT3P6B7_9ALTE|nr:flagellar export protein FliJ [Alteromonas aquimaris]MCW8107626.1 flagellar export protein FliJ [Alteromonas aquimaris]
MSQLKLVVKIEEEKEQKAAQAFQLAQQNVNAQKQKLQNLQQYRLEYLRQIQNNGKGGVTAQKYHQHLSFIGKLDKACEQQMGVISRASLVADDRKQQWIERQKRRKAVEMVIEKQRIAAERKEMRKQQNTMDEYAAQKFYRAQQEKY